LTVPGDLEIAIDGDFSVNCSRTARIDAAALEIESGEAVLKAGTTRFTAGTVDAFMTECRVAVDKLTSVGSWWTAVFDRVTHHARSYMRSTDGLDQVKGKVVRLDAETLVDVHAPHVLTTGEKLVKTRGSQIHFG
jgi:hypothetical protein